MADTAPDAGPRIPSTETDTPFVLPNKAEDLMKPPELKIRNENSPGTILDENVQQATLKRIENAQSQLEKRQEQKDKVDNALEPEKGPPKTVGEKYDRDIADQVKILRSKEKGPDGKPKYGALEKIMASVTVIMLFTDKMKNYSKLNDALAPQPGKEGEQKSPEKTREEQILKQLEDGKDRNGNTIPAPGGYQGLQISLALQIDPLAAEGPAKDLADARTALNGLRDGQVKAKKGLEDLRTQLSTANESEKAGLQKQVADAEAALKVADTQVLEAEKNIPALEKRVQEAKADLDLLRKMVKDREKEAQNFGKQYADLMTGLDTSGVERSDKQKDIIKIFESVFSQKYKLDEKLQGVGPDSPLQKENADKILIELKDANILQSADSYSAIGLEAPQEGATDVKITDFKKFAETAQKYVQRLMRGSRLPSAEKLKDPQVFREATTKLLVSFQQEAAGKDTRVPLMADLNDLFKFCPADQKQAFADGFLALNPVLKKQGTYIVFNGAEFRFDNN